MSNLNNDEIKYTLNISQEELVQSRVREWVLEWCHKYHPEAFKEAEKFIKESLDKQTELWYLNKRS
jgi:hypothetical protein